MIFHKPKQVISIKFPILQIFKNYIYKMKYTSQSMIKMIGRNYTPKIDFIKGDIVTRNNPYEVELWGISIQGT